jgi:hypothetical protein
MRAANTTPWRIFAEVAALAENAEAAPPEDPHAFSLYRLLTGQPAEDVLVETAHAIFTSPYRHVMDALALCAAKDVDVESALELRPGVYAVYRKLFFDRAVFSSVFAMRLYVQQLEVSDEEREVYSLAMQEGALRLLDRYRVGPRPSVDPQVVLEDMLGEAHSRAFEHRGRPITSRVATESFKWGRAAASTAMAMKQSTSSNRIANALEQLEFALTSDDQTKAPEDLGLDPNDIVKG